MPSRSKSSSKSKSKNVDPPENVKKFKLENKILLFTKVQIYTHEFPQAVAAGMAGMSSWKSLTRYNIPLVLIHEKNSDSFFIFAVDKSKILMNLKISLQTMVDRVSEFFATIRNTDSKVTWGIGFPPDGSLAMFRTRVEEIKKHMITIPSLRKEIRVILTTTAQFGFAPIATIVENAILQENLVQVKKDMTDKEWIQDQIGKGNFVTPPPPPRASNLRKSKMMAPVPTSTAKPPRVFNNATARSTRRIVSRRSLNSSLTFIDTRPEFVIPRGKAEIPKPPPVVNGPFYKSSYRPLTNWIVSTSKKYRKQLHAERRDLKNKLSYLEREKMMLEQLEEHHQMKVDAIRDSIHKSAVHERGWQLRLKPLNDANEAWKNRDMEILRFAQEMLNKPAEIREENRAMRSKLAELEALASKRDSELRTKRQEKGLGEYVRAFRTLQKEHDELDSRIAELRQEREGMQQSIFDLSTGITKNIGGLMQTNSIAFNKMDMRLYVPEDGEKTPPGEAQKHRDPISVAEEKVRARRIEIEGRAASMASQIRKLKNPLAPDNQKVERAAKFESDKFEDVSSSRNNGTSAHEKPPNGSKTAAQSKSHESPQKTSENSHGDVIPDSQAKIQEKRSKSLGGQKVRVRNDIFYRPELEAASVVQDLTAGAGSVKASGGKKKHKHHHKPPRMLSSRSKPINVNNLSLKPTRINYFEKNPELSTDKLRYEAIPSYHPVFDRRASKKEKAKSIYNELAKIWGWK